MDVPQGPHTPIGDHGEMIDKKLRQLEAASSRNAPAETFAQIANETISVLEGCITDLVRLREQYTFNKRMLGNL